MLRTHPKASKQLNERECGRLLGLSASSARRAQDGCRRRVRGVAYAGRRALGVHPGVQELGAGRAGRSAGKVAQGHTAVAAQHSQQLVWEGRRRRLRQVRHAADAADAAMRRCQACGDCIRGRS